MFQFYIESEDGTRIYSKATFSKEMTAQAEAVEVVASLMGGYSKMVAEDLPFNWGTERVG